MTPLTRTTRASPRTEAGRLYFEKAALALKELAVAEEMPCVTAIQTTLDLYTQEDSDETHGTGRISLRRGDKCDDQLAVG